MPSDILKNNNEIKIGDIYESCSFHPCLCVEIDEDNIYGISLVNGSYPMGCSIENCAVRILSVEEALKWKLFGPQDFNLEKEYQWW